MLDLLMVAYNGQNFMIQFCALLVTIAICTPLAMVMFKEMHESEARAAAWKAGAPQRAKEHAIEIAQLMDVRDSRDLQLRPGRWSQEVKTIEKVAFYRAHGFDASPEDMMLSSQYRHFYCTQFMIREALAEQFGEAAWTLGDYGIVYLMNKAERTEDMEEAIYLYHTGLRAIGIIN